MCLDDIRTRAAALDLAEKLGMRGLSNTDPSRVAGAHGGRRPQTIDRSDGDHLPKTLEGAGETDARAAK